MRKQIGLFTMAVVAAVAVLWQVGRFPDDIDPFVDANGYRLRLISELPEEDVLEAKLVHARDAPRYDVGLFGNSRVLMVEASDLGLPDYTFFNFGLSGVTLATNVRLLERLAEIDKLPRTVLISFDNPEVPHPARSMIDPNPILRWKRGLGDLFWALHHRSLDGVAVLDHLGHFLGYEWLRWEMTFSFERLRRVLAYRYSRAIFRSGLLAYRTDGSRPEEIPSSEPEFRDVRRDIPAPIAIERDLQRLSRIQREARIIVYESPLQPSQLDRARESPTALAQNLRRRWVTACGEYAIDCRPAPSLGEAGKPPYWPDSSHAPAALLGVWLASLISQHRNVAVTPEATR